MANWFLVYDAITVLVLLTVSESRVQPLFFVICEFGGTGEQLGPAFLPLILTRLA